MEKRASEGRFFTSQLTESAVLAFSPSHKTVTFSFSSDVGCPVLFQYSDRNHIRTAKGQFHISICWRLHGDQMKRGLVLELVAPRNSVVARQPPAPSPPPSVQNSMTPYEAYMARTIIVAPRTSVVRAVRVMSQTVEAPVRQSCIAAPPFDFPLFVPFDFVYSAEVAVAPTRDESDDFPPSPPPSPRDGEETVETRVLLHCHEGCYVSGLKGRFALCQLSLLQLPYSEAVELVPLILKGGRKGGSLMGHLEVSSHSTGVAAPVENGKVPSSPTESSGHTQSVQQQPGYNKYSSILHVSMPTAPFSPSRRIPRVESTDSVGRKREVHHGGARAFAPARRTYSEESLQDLVPPTWFPPLEEAGYRRSPETTPLETADTPQQSAWRKALPEPAPGADVDVPHYDIPIMRASPGDSSPCTCSETSESDLDVAAPGGKGHEHPMKARYDASLLRQLHDRTKSMNDLQKELAEQKERNLQLAEAHAAEKAKLTATNRWLSKGQNQLAHLDSLLEPLREMPNGSPAGRGGTSGLSGWSERDGHLVPPPPPSDGSSGVTQTHGSSSDPLNVVDDNSVEVSCTTSHQVSPTTPGLNLDFTVHTAEQEKRSVSRDVPFPTRRSSEPSPTTVKTASPSSTPHHSSPSSLVTPTGGPFSPADIKPFHRQQPNLGVVATAARHGPFASVGNKKSSFKVSRDEQVDTVAVGAAAPAEERGTQSTLASATAMRPTTKHTDVRQTGGERGESTRDARRTTLPQNGSASLGHERSVRDRDALEESKRTSMTSSLGTPQGSYPLDVIKTPGMSATSMDSHAGKTPNALLADTLRPITPPFLSLTKTSTSMIT